MWRPRNLNAGFSFLILGWPFLARFLREITALHVLVSTVGKKVKVRGLPHLAKNERDMGHPTILGRDKGEFHRSVVQEKCPKIASIPQLVKVDELHP